MPLRKSFKFKLALSYIAVILISFGFIASFLDRKLADNSRQTIESSLINQASLIQSQIAPESLRNKDFKNLDVLAKALSPKIQSRITIVDNRGQVLADSGKPQEEAIRMESHFDRPEIKSALAGSVGINTHYSSAFKTEMLYVALPIRDKNDILGAIRLSIHLTSVKNALWSLRKIVLFGLAIALGLAFMLGSILTAQTVKPINRMIAVSRRFASGDFSRRISGYSGDEIGELAVTLNKMAEDMEDRLKEIQRQNQHLAVIFNSMIEGVIVVDKAGCVVSLNPAIEKIFGVIGAQAQGKLLLEAIRNNDIFEIVNNVLKKGGLVCAELSLVQPVKRSFRINASPIFENNSVGGCLVVIHDITEIKKLENMRRDFVANVSHELKTPLTSIKGFVETLLEGAIDDKENSRYFLNIIYNHTRRLNSLINDLLDLSAIESKYVRFESQECRLRDLTEKVLFGFKSQLKKKAVTFKNDLPLSQTVKADRDSLEQVLTNLIDNAIKFNQENGSIRIDCQGVDGKVKVAIEDSGIGIPLKDLPRIFERFYRVDKARSRELGGTGLGLSIVKHIIELNGGSVGVESTEGLGSKFWFILPK